MKKNCLFFLIAISIVLVGCAQVPVDKETASGYAEETYQNTDLATVQNLLIEDCATRNLRIYEQTNNRLVCGKEMDNGSGMMFQLLMGNAYSTTPVAKTQYNMYQTGKSVRVIGSITVETQMPGGQVRSVESTNVKVRNGMQRMLDSLQRKIPRETSLDQANRPKGKT